MMGISLRALAALCGVVASRFDSPLCEPCAAPDELKFALFSGLSWWRPGGDRVAVGAGDIPCPGGCAERLRGPGRLWHRAFMELETIALSRRGPRILHPDLFRRLCLARDCLASANDLSLATAAQAAGVSRFHFLRLFQQAFGESPHEFRTRLRLDRACRLLEHRRDLTVTDVCLEVGFQSLGSFSTLFARHVGEPPSRYRARRVVVVPGQLISYRVPYCFLQRFGVV